MKDSTVDPVCGMQVSPDSFPLEHLGIHYAFCSQQCRERFSSNPHLYIGAPGQQAPVQQGMEILKRRRFRLEHPLTEAEATVLVDELTAMMGIKRVDVSSDTIAIVYDLLQATASQIEARIGQAGMRLGTGWAERLQRGFVHYSEECEVGNLEVTPHKGHH